VVRGLSAGWGSCLRTVLLDDIPWALVCWKDTLALSSGIHIITLDAATGSKTAILSGHANDVKSLAPSPDGTILVSGSADKTIKVWDMQTGGVIKTFHGHTGEVSSVSISMDCTTIASGSQDHKICLWNIQTGECYCIIQQELVRSICFFPLKSQHFISVSVGKVWEWDINGHQVTPAYNGSCISFSLDGTKFILCNGTVVQVQTSDSREVVTEFHVENARIRNNSWDTRIECCCFSPDGRLIAFAVHHTAYVWDITNSEPSLIETLIGHTASIISLAFLSPTSLISGSWDRSVKFWQIGISSISPDMTDLEPIFYTSLIKSTTLQAKDGIAISSDSDGVVRVWDLSTGLCKASFQTPAKGSCLRDVHLIDNRLVLVWYSAAKIHIWDIKKEKLLQTVGAPRNIQDIRISGDGSKVFSLESNFIHAWYIWTGKAMGKVPLYCNIYLDSFLATGSSSVWVGFYNHNHGIAGWDFGVPGSSSIKEHTEPPNRPHLDFIGGMRQHRSILPGIEDSTTGREVFQPPSRYARPNDAQWDGQYLVAGYDTGEVLILDCNCKIAH